MGSANRNVGSANSSPLNNKGTKLKVCKRKYHKKGIWILILEFLKSFYWKTRLLFEEKLCKR